MMKANYKTHSDVILTGKGAEWSDTSLEVLEQVNNWLSVSNIAKEDITNILTTTDVLINDIVISDKKGIALFADNKVVGLPLICEKKEGCGEKEFLVDSALFFFCLWNEYAHNNSNLESAIKDYFCKKIKL